MSTNVPAVTRPRSRIDIPPLHSRGAPKKFTGHSHDVSKFLSHCDKLFALNNVFTDLEKVQCMAEYCSRSVIHILEGMKPYAKLNWAVLCSHMEYMFDADKDLQCHRPSDLRKLTDKWRKVPIKNMSDWRKYLHQFTRIAGWLHQKGIIDDTESTQYLWKGIHSHLRDVIENRLLSKDPKRDMTVPFSEDDIIGVVDAKFKHSDYSDSEDEFDLKKKKKSKKSKPVVKKKVERTREQAAAPTTRPTTTPAPPVQDSSEDVGELVKRLSKMSIDDHEYNYLYYKATRLDPLVAKCIRAPNLAVNSPPLPPNNFHNNRYVAPPPNQFGQTLNGNQAPPPGDRTCWGCGEKGHTLWECPAMAEPISKGELRRGDRGLEWKDRSMLRRYGQQGETLHHAYLRQHAEHLGQPAPAAQNNLTYAAMAPADCTAVTDEEPILPVFVQSTSTDDELARMFAVTRSSDKQHRPGPYHVPEGNTRPSTRAQVKKTGAQLEGIPDSVKATKKSDARVKQEAVEAASIPPQYPIDEIEHRVDFSREDAIMEDNEPIEGTDHVLKMANQGPKLSKRAGPRQSAVSAFIDPKDILSQVLNTKIDNLSTGQLLAVSPIISNALIEELGLSSSLIQSYQQHFEQRSRWL
ncbi:hypothetical protein B0H13DRAFT_1851694 [Mycena leptocephala]|nr:hypothetical protein B0H13DRAFT_1851694 [Mycena leptocephala]